MDLEEAREAIRTAIAKAEIETTIAEQEISEWRREQILQRTGPESQRGRRIAQLKASPLRKLDWNRQFVSALGEEREAEEGNGLVVTPKSPFESEREGTFRKENEVKEATLEEEKRKLLATLEEKIETAKVKIKRKEKAKIEALKAEIIAGNRREDELKAALSHSKSAESQLQSQLHSLQAALHSSPSQRQFPYTATAFPSEHSHKDLEITQLRDHLNEVSTELEMEQIRREEAESAYRAAAFELNNERIRSQKASESHYQSVLIPLENTIQRLTQDNQSLLALHKSDQELIKRLQIRIETTVSERTTARSRSPIYSHAKADLAPGELDEMRLFYEEKCAGLRKELERWRDKAALLVSRYRGKLRRLREEWKGVKEEVGEYRREVERELDRRRAVTPRRAATPTATYSYRKHR